jgi:hypothetical protein
VNLYIPFFSVGGGRVLFFEQSMSLSLVPDLK